MPVLGGTPRACSVGRSPRSLHPDRAVFHSPQHGCNQKLLLYDICQILSLTVSPRINLYMQLWQKTRDFWVRSYQSDRRAFYYETISAICIFTSTTMLALTAQNPSMWIIYPINFVGAVFSTLSFLRRGAGWPLVMTVYFMHLHVFGFGRSLAWW